MPRRSRRRNAQVLGVAAGLVTALSACGGGGYRVTPARGSGATTPAPAATSPAPSAAAPSSTASTAPAPAAASSPAPLQSAGWKSITVPGAVCHAAQPIRLRHGTATIPAPPGAGAGTPEVTVTESAVAYGDLYGSRDDVAAVNVWCTGAGGTADAQIMNSWVLFRAGRSRPEPVATLTPQRPSLPGSHVAYFDTAPGGIRIRPGSITVKEAWYGPKDGTCCPTGRATTVWSLNASGTLIPRTTVQAYPAGA